MMNNPSEESNELCDVILNSNLVLIPLTSRLDQVRAHFEGRIFIKYDS